LSCSAGKQITFVSFETSLNGAKFFRDAAKEKIIEVEITDKIFWEITIEFQLGGIHFAGLDWL